MSDLESSLDAVERRLVELECSEDVSNELLKLRKQFEKANEASGQRAEKEGRRATNELVAQIGLVILSLATAFILAFQGCQIEKDVDQGEEDRRMVRHFEWLELIYEEECSPNKSCEPVAHPRLRQEAVVSLATLARERRDKLDLSHADLSGLDFSGVDFSGADLESVDFSGANLTDANFTNARLVNVELADATMVRAKLYGANLDRSVETIQFFLFVGPYDGLSRVLRRACGDSETYLPNGLEGLQPFEWLDRPIEPDDHLGSGCPNVIEPAS